MSRPLSAVLPALLALLCLAAEAVQIQLNRVTIDSEAPLLLSASDLPCTQDGHRLYLAAPERLFTEEELAELPAMGAILVNYIPANAYLLSLPAEGVQQLRQRFPGLYLTPYLPAYKVDEALEESLASPALAGAQEPAPLKLRLQLACADQLEETSAALEGLGAKVTSASPGPPCTLRASLPASKVDQAAALPGVVWLEQEGEYRLCNFCAAINTNSDLLRYAGWSGAGETICVADSGLGNGNASGPGNPHMDFAGKSITGTVSSGNDSTSWADTIGHGTHVAGTACGLGNSVITEGVSYTMGMAPDAALYVINIVSTGSGLITPDDGDRDAAYAAGARIMNNSWGLNNNGAYNLYCQEYDAYCYSRPDFLTLCAAGNDNQTIYLVNNSNVNAPGSAKNVLCVGASENGGWALDDTWGEYYFSPFTEDSIVNPANGRQQGLAAFSSRGPTKDGRNKPDLVAPGSVLFSSDYLGSYTSMGGTSMATPCTSGCAAQARQFLRETRQLANPSSALMKAILFNGARQMGTGQYDDYTEIPPYTPNHVNGFGHLDLVQSLSPTNGLLLTATGHVGQDETYVLRLARSSLGPGPVSATLVWTDPPSTPAAAKHLINDLDLQFFDGATNYFANGQTAHNDGVNNAEIIRLSNVPDSNLLELRVQGHNVMTPGGQDFAVAINGCSAIVPEPALSLLIAAGLCALTFKP